MKIPNINNDLFFFLLFIFRATALAKDAQPGSETEWACTHLEMLEDGHTVNYTCSVIGSLTPAIALTSRSYDGNSSHSNNNHSNSTNESGRQHDPVIGTVDLNACVGTTAGHPNTGGGRLTPENDGCLVNVCRNCSFVAAKGGSGQKDEDRYVHEGPFGSRNTSLSCEQCDSAEGLGMTKGSPGMLAVGQFLSFAEKGPRRGLRCKAHTKGKGKGKRDGLGVMRRADILPDGKALPDTMNNNNPPAPANHEQAHVGQHMHNDHQRDNTDSAPSPSPSPSTSDVCASRRSTPWTRFQRSLTAASCDAPELLQQPQPSTLLRTTCPWPGTGDPGASRNITSTLDLDGCLRNANGQLVPAPDGGYAASCRDCRVDVADQVQGQEGERGVALVCMCSNGKYEGGAEAQLDGTGTLQVVAGTLMCQGKLGVVEEVEE
ncbi:hypothetical protein F4775DRAFT_597589 [Biscogniauxia sp. FL1348]|nr:hypothetical protein F4775DRAFT_597589 [Biscogniauxia sp. FL1348]